MEQEIWKRISPEEVSKYEVSNYGRIRRWSTRDNDYNDIAYYIGTGGKAFFSAIRNDGGPYNTLCVPTEVAKAFGIKHPPDDGQRWRLTHINGCRTDCHVRNLKWETYEISTDKPHRQRTYIRHNPFSRKTGENILKLMARGYSHSEIIRMYPGANYNNLWALANGKMSTKWCRGGI